jgi:GntR family transcriptional regulator, transcriptional repressor for pyruvate dehydrogenase complex
MENMKIRQTTVVEQVMEKIRELIVSGRYQVSDKLPTESELASMFGIGRSSIREAIKVFNYLGILESKTAKGTYVCNRTNISSEAISWSVFLGNDDVYDVLEMRESMEMWSLISITEKYTRNPEEVKTTLDELKNIIELMELSVKEKSIDNLIELDYRFHNTIIKGSQNSLFISIYKLLRTFLYEEIKQTFREVTNLEDRLKEHSKFILAIESGDTRKVQEILRGHISTIKMKLEKKKLENNT